MANDERHDTEELFALTSRVNMIESSMVTWFTNVFTTDDEAMRKQYATLCELREQLDTALGFPAADFSTVLCLACRRSDNEVAMVVMAGRALCVECFETLGPSAAAAIQKAVHALVAYFEAQSREPSP